MRLKKYSVFCILYDVVSNLYLIEHAMFAGFQLHTDYVRNGGARRMAQVEDWEMEAACPQGVQGDSDQQENCGHFLTWLENCRRYGLANCDEQLQVCGELYFFASFYAPLFLLLLRLGKPENSCLQVQ